MLSADQSLDAGLGDDRVYLFAGYQVAGEPVYPRTVIDLEAGTGRVPAYDLTFPFAGTDELTSYLPALTWFGTDGPETLVTEAIHDVGAGRLVAHGRGGSDRIDGTRRADLIDGGDGWDRADAWGGDDECIDVEVERGC